MELPQTSSFVAGQTQAAPEVARGEWLSALFDGECSDAAVQALLAQGDDASDRATWDLYRCIGDALRAGAASAAPADPARVQAVMARVATLPRPERPAASTPITPLSAQTPASPTRTAANDALFRWRLVAGLATVAAVVAIGWQIGAVVGSTPSATLADNASAVAPVRTVAAPAVPPVAAGGTSEGREPVLRDPQLEELLAAHRQWGGASALQPSVGFLRAASFDTPGR
jgi:sigma-E factor negative regulatory protein RseA